MPQHLSDDEASLALRPVRELSNDELDTFRVVCSRMVTEDTSMFRRWKWDRAWRRASIEFMRRANERLGTGPALCERCGQRPPTCHVLFGHGAEERQGHFCDACRKLKPTGWLARFDHDEHVAKRRAV